MRPWILIFVALIAFDGGAQPYACPPFGSRLACLSAADDEYTNCRNTMAEYFQDKDNITDKSSAFYMYNRGCMDDKINRTESCEDSCK